MGRNREFDRDQVLERALGVFWRLGFAASSVSELIDAMGIGRASLYATFGSKRALFIEALDYYERGMEVTIFEPLRGDGSPLALLRRFFEDSVKRYCAEGRPVCLTVKTAVAGEDADPEIASRVRATTARLDQAFTQLLRRARSLGELRADKNAARLARYLTQIFQTLSIGSAIRGDEKIMLEIVRDSLSILD